MILTQPCHIMAGDYHDSRDNGGTAIERTCGTAGQLEYLRDCSVVGREGRDDKKKKYINKFKCFFVPGAPA